MRVAKRVPRLFLSLFSSQRNDLTREWKAPFMLGDPEEWMDRTRENVKTRDGVELPGGEGTGVDSLPG